MNDLTIGVDQTEQTILTREISNAYTSSSVPLAIRSNLFYIAPVFGVCVNSRGQANKRVCRFHISCALSSPYCRRSRNRDSRQASMRPLWVAY
jgi:hypothetical protein